MIEASVLKQRSGEKVGDGSEPVWKEEDEIILSDADHEGLFLLSGPNLSLLIASFRLTDSYLPFLLSKSRCLDSSGRKNWSEDCRLASYASVLHLEPLLCRTGSKGSFNSNHFQN